MATATKNFKRFFSQYKILTLLFAIVVIWTFFGQLTEGDGSDCCAAHEGKFVEKVLLQDALRPDAQYVEAAQDVWQGVEDANDQPVGHDLGKTFIRDHTNGEKHGGYCHNGDFAPFVVVPVFMLVPMIMAAGAAVIVVDCFRLRGGRRA